MTMVSGSETSGVAGTISTGLPVPTSAASIVSIETP